MQKYGVPENVRKMIMTLSAHENKKIYTRTELGLTEEVKPECGLAQGSPISTYNINNIIHICTYYTKMHIVNGIAN